MLLIAHAQSFCNRTVRISVAEPRTYLSNSLRLGLTKKQRRRGPEDSEGAVVMMINSPETGDVMVLCQTYARKGETAPLVVAWIPLKRVIQYRTTSQTGAAIALHPAFPPNWRLRLFVARDRASRQKRHLVLPTPRSHGPLEVSLNPRQAQAIANLGVGSGQ